MRRYDALALNILPPDIFSVEVAKKIFVGKEHFKLYDESKGGDYLRKLILLLALVLLSSCQENDIGGKSSTPPKLFITIDGTKHYAKLGTYCWEDKCVDMAGQEELLEGKEVVVAPEEEMKVELEKHQNGTKMVAKRMQGELWESVSIEDGVIIAPR